MDPEILQALEAGYTPQEIAEELTRRGLPVPPELKARIAQAPTPLEQLLGSRWAAGAAIGGGLGGAALHQLYSPEPAALRRLKAAIKETPGGIPALQEQLDAFKAVGRGNLATLGDLAPRMGAEADFVAQSHVPARLALSEINQQRQAGVPRRVLQDVISLSPTGAVAPRQEIAQTRAQKASFAASEQGFEGLRQANPTLSDPESFAEALKKPENAPLRDAYLKARAQSLSAGGTGEPSFRLLQDAKRDLDARISSAFAAGNGDLARELKGARERLFDIMEQQVGPQYRDIVSTYRDMSRKEELLQEGMKWWKSRKLQTADLKAKIKSLNPDELDAFRRGVAGGLMSDIENAKTNTNIARSLLKESAATQEKLNLIFGGPENAQAFVNRLRIEDKLARLSDVVGQSATLRRAQALGEPLATGEDLAHLITHPGTGFWFWLSKTFGPKRIAQQAAKGMSPMFTTQGASALEELLQNLARIR